MIFECGIKTQRYCVDWIWFSLEGLSNQLTALRRCRCYSASPHERRAPDDRQIKEQTPPELLWAKASLDVYSQCRKAAC